jgi:hypothetical protein
MDYPAPLVTMNGATIDTSHAYDRDIGEWDQVAIRWLYGEFGEGDAEQAALDAVLDQRDADGLLYITDRHARGNNSAHPLANLWDNGADPVAMLDETMAVRAAALDRFGTHTLAAGRPLSDLRDVFSPIYLYHRYQVEAVGKYIGGVVFDYERNGVDARGLATVPAQDQRRALASLAATLNPAALDISDATLALMSPAPFSDYDAAATRELFESPAYPAFSRTAAAGAAARITLEATLAPARLARLADQSARDANHLSPGEVFDTLEAALFNAPRNEAERLRPVRETVQIEYAEQLMSLAASASPAVASLARQRLEALSADLPSRRDRSAAAAHRLWLARSIAAGLERIDAGETPEIADTPVPPGSPIGADSCWHCDSASLLGFGR